MTHSSDLPQIRAEEICFAPNLFRSIKLKGKELPLLDANLLLQDVSFDVFAGDRIALVGASGAGKTTLLRLLNRLSEPTAGRLYLNGRPYAALPPMQLRQQVVMMLQESKLLGMTVQEAIAYPLQLRGMDKQAIQQRVGDWMERLRVPLEWRDRTEQQLSVGQRQLVAIARALITEPAILLLDEPTSALDAGRTQQVFETLIELNQQQQTTILMVNHQLEQAQQLATRVLHLHQGKLVGDEAAITVDWARLGHSLKTAEQEQAAEWQ
ncbi:MAG: ATP-binding cassette domain-containing protein [Leptolyngbyaceae cyanobacterium bins.302]|nr:ATP-binding cassette domain-containing protein [Leptolyngbyaceae cyanobacterium bins.302]